MLSINMLRHLSSTEVASEQENRILDPVDIVNTDLRKTVVTVKSEESALYLNNLLEIKEEIKLEDLSMVNELMVFNNLEESSRNKPDHTDNPSTSTNEVEMQKLTLITDGKTFPMAYSFDQVKLLQKTVNQNDNSFNTDTYSDYHRNTSEIQTKIMDSGCVNNFNTPFNVSPNTNLLINMLQTSSLPYQNKRNYEEQCAIESEVIQIRSYLEDGASDPNHQTSSGRTDLSSRKSKSSKENELNVIEISESSGDGDIAEKSQSISLNNNTSTYKNHSASSGSSILNWYEACKNSQKVAQNHPSSNAHKVKLNLPNPVKKFVCQKCDKGFVRRPYLERHESEVHGNVKQFVCPHCCKAYNNRAGMDYHIKSKHTPPSQVFKCHKCRKYYGDQNKLERHIQGFHKGTEIKIIAPVSVPCDLCDKVYKRKDHMMRHKIRKHNIHNKQFICNDCSAVFPDRNLIITHIQVAHMDPEYKCSLCSNLFSTKVKLTAHLRIQHGIENRKTYVCDTCGKTTKNKNALMNHMATHSDEKHFVCVVCGKTFKTESNLTQHSLTHSDVRKFGCDLCEKSFRIRHHLKQHMAVHGLAILPNYGKIARRKKAANFIETSDEDSSDESSE